MYHGNSSVSENNEQVNQFKYIIDVFSFEGHSLTSMWCD